MDDLGVEPALELRELHQQVLDGTARLPHVTSGRPGGPGALPAPAQLPPTVKRLVGRDELLADIRQALAGRRGAPSVVVLTGPGGVGKPETGL